MEQEDYVSLEVAKLLKEKNYNIPCTSFYDSKNNKHEFKAILENWNHRIWGDKVIECFTSIPTLFEVAKWLREKHNKHITVGNSASGYWWELSKADNGTLICDYNYKGSNDGGKYNTYEEALNEGIKEALKYI